jgi:hypothetical protein
VSKPAIILFKKYKEERREEREKKRREKGRGTRKTCRV